jgi:hypothetical protein
MIEVWKEGCFWHIDSYSPSFLAAIDFIPSSIAFNKIIVVKAKGSLDKREREESNKIQGRCIKIQGRCIGQFFEAYGCAPNGNGYAQSPNRLTLTPLRGIFQKAYVIGFIGSKKE